MYGIKGLNIYYLFIDSYIYSIRVLRRTDEYLLHTTVINIVMEGNRAVLRGNRRPSTPCLKTTPRLG